MERQCRLNALGAKPDKHGMGKGQTNISNDHIKHGYLHALAVSATNYSSGRNYRFIQGAKNHPVWSHSQHMTLATKITVDHICASAAVPLVFEPVKLTTARGPAFFGDGCLALRHPLSPIIRLGAEAVFAIDVRCQNVEHEKGDENKNNPSLAQVVGILLSALFLNHLTSDVEQLERMNQMFGNGQVRQTHVEKSGRMRRLQSLLITPSVDLAELAEGYSTDMPYLIQYFVVFWHRR